MICSYFVLPHTRVTLTCIRPDVRVCPPDVEIVIVIFSGHKLRVGFLPPSLVKKDGERGDRTVLRARKEKAEKESQEARMFWSSQVLG